MAVAGQKMRHLVDSMDTGATIAAAGLAGRYAVALFELALKNDTLADTAAALGTVKQALAESSDFRRLVASRHLPRPAVRAAVAAVAATLQLPTIVANFLGVLAENGRLSELPSILRQFETLHAAHRGSTSAEVIAAQPLSADQVAALEAKLKARTGRTITADVTVDPAILGGLIVRIGSEQIDSSVRTRLERLGQQMKG